MNGMPAEVWQHQERWAHVGQAVHPDMQEVTSSFLQGDPFSLVALSANLAPLRGIKGRCPDVQTKLYVDDRTWTSSTPTTA